MGGGIRAYAGIGSRITPQSVLFDMTILAKWLSKEGFILRSGKAKGADTAFEKGIDPSRHHLDCEIFTYKDATEEAIKHASKYHPAWNNCNDYIKQLHGRNSMIMLGENLDNPVKFVVCYTEKAKEIGGTGQSIRIANDLNIPVFNFYNKSLADFHEWYKQKENDIFGNSYTDFM